MPTDNEGNEYTRIEDSDAELLAWGPSIRALVQSRDYDHYLELMAEYTASVTASVDEAFGERRIPVSEATPECEVRVNVAPSPGDPLEYRWMVLMARLPHGDGWVLLLGRSMTSEIERTLYVTGQCEVTVR